jgi:predicted ester cyclase
MTRISTGETKAAARRFYDALNQALATGDLALLDEVIAEDAVDHNPVPGMKQGLAGIKESFGEGRVAFPDLHFTVEDMVAEGDKVACRITVRATHRGDFRSIRATGRQVTMTGIDILRIVDGKLADRWGEFDNLGLLQQLGAVTLPS